MSSEPFLFQRSPITTTVFLFFSVYKAVSSLQQLNKTGASELIPDSKKLLLQTNTFITVKQLSQNDSRILEEVSNATNSLIINGTNPGMLRVNVTDINTVKHSKNATVTSPEFTNNFSTTIQVPIEKYENTLAGPKGTTVPFQSSASASSHFPKRIPEKELANCKKYTECELYQKLEESGGRNQLFMANSPEEAGRNFARLVGYSNSDTFEHDEVPKLLFDQSIDDEKCDWSCTMIKEALVKWLSSENHLDGSIDKLEFHDQTSDETQRAKAVNNKNPCRLEQFVPVGNCTLRGKEEIDGYEKLCSSCHGIYILSSNCFPRFLNSVTCDNDDGKCIFDMIPKAYGKCHLKTLSFEVLHNRGTLNCEKWTRAFIDLPIACECYLGANALGLSAIGVR